MDKLASGEFGDCVHVPHKDLGPWVLVLGSGFKKVREVGPRERSSRF